MAVSLRTLGAVPGYVLGSMSQGSTTLTITGTHSIRVGHTVIVECGGEAGAGARATVGVGGTWPATSFADEATLLATWTHPATTDGSSSAAYAQDTGNVFYWDGANIVQPASHLYHQRKFWPRALIAVVDAVDGSTITLDTAATVATTGARVWVDCQRILQDAMHIAGLSLEVPEGVYAVSSKVTNTGGVSMGSDYSDGITLFGGGDTSELYSPLGCQSLTIVPAQADNVTVRDLLLRPNVSHTAGLLGKEGFSSTYAIPLFFSQCVAPTVERVTVTNCEWGGVALTGCSSGNVRSCVLQFTNARHTYLGIWAVQFDTCTDTNSWDCSVDSDWICTAAEHFKSTNCTHSGLTIRNGQIASNSSVGSFYDDLTITIEADSARPLDHDPLFLSNSTVVIDWNKNTGSAVTPEGGGIRGLTFTQTGEIGQGFKYYWVFARASTLDPAGDPIVLENATFETNGHVFQGTISALTVAQPILIDGAVCDAQIDLVNGTISNSSAPILRYDSDTVTFGSGNNFTVMQDVL